MSHRPALWTKNIKPSLQCLWCSYLFQLSIVIAYENRFIFVLVCSLFKKKRNLFRCLTDIFLYPRLHVFDYQFLVFVVINKFDIFFILDDIYSVIIMEIKKTANIAAQQFSMQAHCLFYLPNAAQSWFHKYKVYWIVMLVHIWINPPFAFY